MFQELEDIKEKYRQLTLSLSDPALASNPQKIKKVAKERADLEPLVKKYEDYQKINKDISESEEIFIDPQVKFESGVHRVQRVPQTEASGRIHTSTVTVAILPEADDVDIELDPKDLKRQSQSDDIKA